MKRILSVLKSNRPTRVIARFGVAQLIQNETGKLQLDGGSFSEYTEAKEWVSMFMHEAILSENRSRTAGRH
jgi:hypothetical protein